MIARFGGQTRLEMQKRVGHKKPIIFLTSHKYCPLGPCSSSVVLMRTLTNSASAEMMALCRKVCFLPATCLMLALLLISSLATVVWP